MAEKAFGMPAFVQPQNINLPRKGSRQTMHFREDSQRLSTVPVELRNYNWARAMGTSARMPVLATDEDELLGRICNGDVLMDDMATPVVRASAATLLRLGLATQAYLTLSATPAGILWYKAAHGIKGIYEQERSDGSAAT